MGKSDISKIKINYIYNIKITLNLIAQNIKS